MAITSIVAYNFSGDKNEIQSVNSQFMVMLSVGGANIPSSFKVLFKDMNNVLLGTFYAIQYTTGKYYIDCGSFFKTLFDSPKMSVLTDDFASLTVHLKMYCDSDGLNQEIPLQIGLFQKQYGDTKQFFNVLDTAKLVPVAFVGVPCNLGYVTWSNGQCELTSLSSINPVSMVSPSTGRAGIYTYATSFGSSGAFKYQAKITYTDIIPIEAPFDLPIEVLPFPCDGVVINYINRFGVPSYWVFEKYRESQYSNGNQIYVDNFINSRYNSNVKGLGSIGNAKTLKVVSNQVPKKYWWCLTDLVSSPIIRVFNGGDYSNDMNYTGLKVKTKTSFIENYDKEFDNFEIEFEYPKQFTVNFL